MGVGFTRHVVPWLHGKEKRTDVRSWQEKDIKGANSGKKKVLYLSVLEIEFKSTKSSQVYLCFFWLLKVHLKCVFIKRLQNRCHFQKHNYFQVLRNMLLHTIEAHLKFTSLEVYLSMLWTLISLIKRPSVHTECLSVLSIVEVVPLKHIKLQ